MQCALLIKKFSPETTHTRLGCFNVTAILSWGYGWGRAEDVVEAEVE